jgi:hypothetical protein
MKLIAACRTPYHVRAIARSAATGPISDAKLGRAIVLTQIVLLVLSVARVAADDRQSPPSVEGIIALVVVVSLVGSLAAKAIHWATRQNPKDRGGRSKRHPSNSLLAGTNRARAT